jgi:hypothetical protein
MKRIGAGIALAFLLAAGMEASAGPLQVKPEFPSIDRRGASLVIALRHTAIGWKDAYGFDTFLYRFFGDPRVGFSGASLGELRPDGERTAANYRFSTLDGGGRVAVRRIEAGGLGTETLECVLGVEKDLIRVSGPVSRSVGLDAQGRVRFASPEGDYEESYPFGLPRPWGELGAVTKRMNGKTIAEGKFLAPWSLGEALGGRLRYVERKPGDRMGVEAVEANYWEESGAILFRVEGVEPLAEGCMYGFPGFSPDPFWLRCLALVDATVGEGGILRVAYVAANTFQSVSSSGGVAVSSSRSPVLGWGMDSFQE